MSEPRPIVHVVDDDASLRRAVARLLTVGGYEVRAHASVADFLAANPDGEPGCVVADLRMPGQSGLDLQAALVRSGSPMRVVFLSAQADGPTTVRALRDGAEDFLSKPVSKDDLFAAVERALAHGAAERARRAAR